ncbi:hypothetical protein U9M48_003563 [Paspalum notatum var. saurae]|uniref:Uncharacterized protein n=1 Tax=Paspalum notatum var. saurae TaxID=547442 RepID=A0AAQ3PRD6_PASNO
MQGTAAAGAGGNAPSAWVAMAHNGSLVNYHALRNKSLRPGDPSSTCPLQFGKDLLFALCLSSFFSDVNVPSVISSYSALQLFIGALSPGARAGAPSSQRGPNLVVYKLRLFSKDGTCYVSVREINSDARVVFVIAVAYNDDQNVIHAMAGSLLDKFEEKELQFLSKVENQPK